MIDLKNVNPTVAESLKKAERIEDVITILKAEGAEITQADAEEIWNNIQEWKARQSASDNLAVDSSELSLDELEAVSGGQDYFKEGCHSTVEAGSSCFLSSDSCSFSFYYYDHEPVPMNCPQCGRIGGKYGGRYYYPDIAVCRYCHRTYNYVTGEFDVLKTWIIFDDEK